MRFELESVMVVLLNSHSFEKNKRANMIPNALSIAGSDSGGGAGIQADLKTFGALGVYGASVITAVTAQNTVEVTAVATIAAPVVRAQIDAVVADFDVRAITAPPGRRRAHTPTDDAPHHLRRLVQSSALP